MKHLSLIRAFKSIGIVEIDNKYAYVTCYKCTCGERIVIWNESNGDVLEYPLCILKQDEKCKDYGFNKFTIKSCIKWLIEGK